MSQLFQSLRRQRYPGRQVVAASLAQLLGRDRLNHDLIAPLGFLADDGSATLVLFHGLVRVDAERAVIGAHLGIVQPPCPPVVADAADLLAIKPQVAAFPFAGTDAAAFDESADRFARLSQAIYQNVARRIAALLNRYCQTHHVFPLAHGRYYTHLTCGVNTP